MRVIFNMKDVCASRVLSFPGLILSEKVPLSLASFLAKSQGIVVQTFNFFGRVYHCTMKEPQGASMSVFVQFDECDHVQDMFCQCDASQEAGVCIHIAETIRQIFSHSSVPLHRRFLSSPYYQFLFQHEVVQKECCVSKTKLTFALKEGVLEVEGEIESLLSMLEAEGEMDESSIKFAHLTEEDLNAWYQKRPSKKLAFELSYACDVARFLFQKENKEGPPTCSLHDGVLSMVWPDLRVHILLVREADPMLFGSLSSYPGSFKVNPYAQAILKTCVYDIETESLRLTWEGTSARNMPVWKKIKQKWVQEFPKVYEECVKEALVQESLLENLLNNGACSTEFFDTQEHVLEWELALSEVHGMSVQAVISGSKEKVLWCIGRWAWTQEGRFVRTRGSFFSAGAFTILLQDLSSFIDHARNWLSLFEEFYVHNEPLLKDISYHVDSQGALSFCRKNENSKRKDFCAFGSWIYVPKQGFFVHQMEQSKLLLQQSIGPHRVAQFIRKHRLELKNVEGFFAEKDPIEKVELSIRQEKKSIIRIDPLIVWNKASFAKEVLFFEEFGYIPSVGFFELSSSVHLAREITRHQAEEWCHFFEVELPAFEKRADCVIDPLLRAPQTLRLMCKTMDQEDVEESVNQEQILASKDHLWDVDFFWKSPLGIATFEEVSAAKRRHDTYLITNAGTLRLSDNRFEWLLVLTQGKKKGESLRKLKTWDFLKIKAHEEVQFDVAAETSPRSFIDKLLHDKPMAPLPSMNLLNSTLRFYQQAGLEWLWMLYSFGLSGLLCDDMGVGKTHQAMALLAVIKEFLDKKDVKRSFLIVCPTSLIWHWKEKIEKYLPSFTLCTYVGQERDLQNFLQNKQDLFLTTYGIFRNEHTRLCKIHFEVAIFDELQIAKNHVSRIWSALSSVQATMRIGLTGTPIENQLRELKALFDLLLPGYLPEDSLFRELYVRPYERSVIEMERFDALSRYVRPFVLRRKKSDVLKDLPEKVEECYHVELAGDQKNLYRQVATQQAGVLIQQLRDESIPIPYIHIFALLSALKQICNHPAAYLKEVEQYEQYESGKWEAFVELVEEAIESGQKVVVFSQFLSMLDIIKLHLGKQGIGYAEIRGRTKERGVELARFQGDPSCRVFLGSLQAAGLGIDLTAASVVIHYDRWWNAARENQATDRVHRMGQERGVQVCKLITVGTVEERIDTMIERKSQLLEDVISYDDHQVVKRLSRAELLELFSDVEQMSKGE